MCLVHHTITLQPSNGPHFLQKIFIFLIPALGLFVTHLPILLCLQEAFMTAPTPTTIVPAPFSTSSNSSHLSSTLHVCSVKPSFNYLQLAVITSNALCCIVFKFLIKHLSHLPPVQVQIHTILLIHGTWLLLWTSSRSALLGTVEIGNGKSVISELFKIGI